MRTRSCRRNRSRARLDVQVGLPRSCSSPFISCSMDFASRWWATGAMHALSPSAVLPATPTPCCTARNCRRCKITKLDSPPPASAPAPTVPPCSPSPPAAWAARPGRSVHGGQSTSGCGLPTWETAPMTRLPWLPRMPASPWEWPGVRRRWRLAQVRHRKWFGPDCMVWEAVACTAMGVAGSAAALAPPALEAGSGAARTGAWAWLHGHKSLLLLACNVGVRPAAPRHRDLAAARYSTSLPASRTASRACPR